MLWTVSRKRYIGTMWTIVLMFCWSFFFCLRSLEITVCSFFVFVLLLSSFLVSGWYWSHKVRWEVFLLSVDKISHVDKYYRRDQFLEEIDLHVDALWYGVWFSSFYRWWNRGPVRFRDSFSVTQQVWHAGSLLLMRRLCDAWNDQPSPWSCCCFVAALPPFPSEFMIKTS